MNSAGAADKMARIARVQPERALDPITSGSLTRARRRRAQSRLLRVGLIVLVSGSVGALGAVHDWALVGAGAVALSLGTFCVLTPFAKPEQLPLPAVVLLGLAAYTALQCIPLPLALLTLLAPNNAAIWIDAKRLVGETVAYAPISVAPSGSYRECLKWAIYASTLLVAARVTRRRGAHWVPELVGVTAVLCALSILGHGVFDAQRYLGLYRPVEAGIPWALGPLMNPNNLSGYLNVGIFCLLGVALSRRRQRWRGLAVLGAGTCVAISVSYGSRAAIATLLAGLATLVVLIALGVGRRWMAPTQRLHHLGLVGSVALAGAGLVLALGSSALLPELIRESTAKLKLFPWTWDMVRDFPWFGAGRGSFDTVFPAYAQANAHLRFQYSENFLTQWMTEWGVPVTVVAMATLARAYWKVLWTSELRAIELSSALGLAVLFAQNLLDIALEVPAVGIMVSALLGGLWSPAQIDHRPAGESWHSPTGGAPPVRLAGERDGTRSGQLAACALLLAAFPLLWVIPSTLSVPDEERRRLRATLLDPHHDPHALLDQTARLVTSYPADPYFALVGAHLTVATGTGDGLRWAGQAIRRAPDSGHGYLALARLLHGRGVTGQGLRMVAMAIERTPALTPSAAEFVLSVTRDPRRLRRAAPGGPRGLAFLVALAKDRSIARDYDLRLELLETAVAGDHAGESRPRLALLHTLTACLEDGTSVCQGRGRAARVARARALITLLKRSSDTAAWTVLAEAKLLLLEGEGTQAFTLLTEGCAESAEALDCQALRLRAVPAESSARAIESAVDDYLHLACASATPCVQPLVTVAELFASHRLWERAADFFSRAAALSCSAALWVRAAEAANRAGNTTRALSALRRAEELRR